MTSPTERIVSALTIAGCKPQKSTRSGWASRCPAHDDQSPSLSVREGDDGKTLVHCHAGCTPEDVCQQLGLGLSDLMTSPASRRNTPSPTSQKWATAEEAISYLETSRGSSSNRWSYQDKAGNTVGRVVRWDTADGKEIRPVSLRGDGWVIQGMLDPRPLYRLPDLLSAKRVFICEGEKAADAARSIGLVATTSAHGAKSPRKTDWSPLAGKECVILPDKDKAGDEYCEAVGGLLSGLSPQPTVKVLHLDGLPEHGDMDDWVSVKGDVSPDDLRGQLVEMAEDAEPQSFRAAPIGGEAARIEYCPVPVTELECDEDINWLWEGYIARDHVTLFVGIWKGGKTTLLAHLFKAMENGGELGGDVFPCKILVVTEEGKGHWARRRDIIGIGSHLSIASRPFKGRPTQNDWEMLIDMIAKDVERVGFDLVVIDSWQAVNPSQDENNASDTMAALAPLSQLSEAGAAVLLVHHPNKKGNADQGQASRGSGALTGWVDTIVELRRFSTNDNRDRRRVLKAYGRFDETPDEVVVELTDDGYTCVGTAGDAKQSDRFEVIAEILDSDWRTREDIRDRWPVGTIPKPGTSTIRTDLNAGFEAGEWERQGEGRKGDPFVYRFVSRKLPPLREENESESPGDEEESGDGATDDGWEHPGAA